MTNIKIGNWVIAEIGGEEFKCKVMDILDSHMILAIKGSSIRIPVRFINIIRKTR